MSHLGELAAARVNVFALTSFGTWNRMRNVYSSPGLKSFSASSSRLALRYPTGLAASPSASVTAKSGSSPPYTSKKPMFEPVRFFAVTVATANFLPSSGPFLLKIASVEYVKESRRRPNRPDGYH